MDLSQPLTVADTLLFGFLDVGRERTAIFRSSVFGNCLDVKSSSLRILSQTEPAVNFGLI